MWVYVVYSRRICSMVTEDDDVIVPTSAAVGGLANVVVVFE